MMIDYQEERSLLEVREWKERCRLSNLHLSPEEYLNKLERIAQEVKAKYHLNLPQVNQPLALNQTIKT